MKLVQKHLIKGSQSFELLDDRVDVVISPRFGPSETLTVMLSVLNPEPVISRASLDFVSRVNGEALISLWMEKPDVQTFNQFVSTLKKQAEAGYSSAFGLRSEGLGDGPPGMVNEEPPEFGEEEVRIRQTVDGESIETSIQMLENHVGEDAGELVAALRELQAAPNDNKAMAQVVKAFNGLGPRQGAVLTYAPYISVLLSDDPFGYG
ncbi:MAG: hypothetical protein ACPG4N_03815 [Gammaproteobacteria bacterium]